MTHSTTLLKYQILKPNSSPKNSPPVVFLLHGYGSNEFDLLSLSRYFPSDAFIVSLRAPLSVPGGYAWYPLEFSESGELIETRLDQFSIEEIICLINSTYAHLSESYDFDENRSGILGFSQGAMISMALFSDATQPYSWCAGLHGYLHDFHISIPKNRSNKPIFITAGTDDPIIPFSKVKETANVFSSIGFDVSFSTYSGGHGICEDLILDFQKWLSQNTI